MVASAPGLSYLGGVKTEYCLNRSIISSTLFGSCLDSLLSVLFSFVVMVYLLLLSQSGSHYTTGCRVKLEGKTEIRHIKF